MGSAIVTWKGRCSDSDLQDRLVGFIGRLADEHARCWQAEAIDLPPFSEILARERAKGLPVDPPRCRYAETIIGRVAVCSDVIRREDQVGLVDEVGRLGLETTRTQTTRSRNFHVWLDRVHVKGLDFRFYDPRCLYPGEDRFSCVFLESPQWPFLDGLLAKVSGPQWCEQITDEALKGADYYIECPFLHLRYYLEDWLVSLLSWIKYFFIPELYYFHNEPLAEYERHLSTIEQIVKGFGHDVACERLFAQILANLARETDEFAQKPGLQT